MEERMRLPLERFIRSGGPTVAPEMDEESKPIAREVGVRNMFIQHRLYELIGRLSSAGVRCIVLKGAHLIHGTYPFGIRPIEDIDVLFDPADFPKVEPLLRQMGYDLCDVGMDRWTQLNVSNKMTFSANAHPVIPIDVHFSLGPYPYLGAIERNALFEHTETLRLQNGLSLTVLRPEMLLVHLCLHLFQHHFEDWQVSCCDIIAVLRTTGDRFDWSAFSRIVDARRLRLPVAYALRKARDFAAVDVPDEWTRAENEAGGSRFERWVYRSSQTQRRGFDRYFLQFVTTPGWTLKVQCAWKIVFPGRLFLNMYYGGSYAKFVREAIKIAVNGITAMSKRE